MFLESITLANSGWARLARGEPRPDLFARHLELSLQLGNDDGIGFALEGLAACAAAAGDVERAGILLGAGETVRLRTGLVDQRSNLTYRPFVDRILASDAAADFEAARGRGGGCPVAWPSTSCSTRRSRSHHDRRRPAAAIRTPDQRLRVFVSSTLKELEPERRAARAAIERMQLAPVMFELGARPHPPQQLYRAYLEQSDVFVGDLLAAVRLDRARRGDLGPRGRVPARAAATCRSSST